LVAVVSIALGARTLARNADYKSSLRLAETTAAGWPTPAADSMLGTELAAAGRLGEAEAALRRAAVAYEPARYYLATVLAAEGQTDSAIAAFEAYLGTSLQSLAEVRKAREMLADLYARRGRWAAAATQYQMILERDPDDAATHGRLADALMSSADYVQAIPHYQALLAARPADARALGGLGIAYAQTGRVDDAIATFQRAVDADPRSAHAEQNLARALLTAGRRDEARTHAERAAALNPADPATRDLLERIR
jgi:superkiller protein 3